MKCQCWVLPYQNKKNKAKLLVYPQGTRELAEQQLTKKEVLDKRPNDIERCGGKIIVTVEAIDEPYYGGSSAVLEIIYKCGRCGSLWDDDERLLTTYTIGDFLTKYVENLE